MTSKSSDKTEGLASLRIDRDALESEAVPRPYLRWVVIAALVAGALLAGRWAWISFVKPLGMPEVRTEMAISLTPANSRALLTATGYIVAQRQAAVTSKITGRLASLEVVEGSNVRKSQVIGRLEDRDFRAALEESRRSLEVAKAAHAEAAARELEARREFRRQERLLEEKVTSQADFDAAEARHQVAVARMESAGAAVPQAEAAVTVAEVALSNTLIIAPFDGVVTTKNSEIGEIVAPVSAGGPASGNSVVLIADMSSLEAEVDINETNIARIKEGQPAEIIVDAFPGTRFPGRLRQIVPTANRQKATIQGKVAFTGDHEGVLPEMSTRVTFLAAEEDEGPAAERRVFIKRNALLSRGETMAVFVIKDGAVIETPVEVGPEVEGRVEIVSGLRGGELLVSQPSADLRSGTKVRVGNAP